MNRLLLINKKKSPSREELVTSERRMGEILFARWPGLRFGGYMIATNTGKLAVQWIIGDEDLESIMEFARTVEPENYQIAIYGEGLGHFGNKQEVRIL